MFFFKSKKTKDFMVLAEEYEHLIESIYSMVIQPNDICIDMGAHYGRHTFPMARLVGEGGKIIAFEPISKVLDVLQAQAPRELRDRILPLNLALANFHGTADFFEYKKLPAYSGLRFVENMPELINQASVFKAQVTTLDRVMSESVNQNTKVSFIKADLEGGEFHALLGATKTIERHRPVIAFENMRSMSAERFGYSKEDFFSFFYSRNYELFDISGEAHKEEYWHQWGPWYTLAYPSEFDRSRCESIFKD